MTNLDRFKERAAVAHRFGADLLTLCEEVECLEKQKDLLKGNLQAAKEQLQNTQIGLAEAEAMVETLQDENRRMKSLLERSPDLQIQQYPKGE